jgi:flagellar biosynthesis/type III secretory pathway protein FliH
VEQKLMQLVMKMMEKLILEKSILGKRDAEI